MGLQWRLGVLRPSGTPSDGVTRLYRAPSDGVGCPPCLSDWVRRGRQWGLVARTLAEDVGGVCRWREGLFLTSHWLGRRMVGIGVGSSRTGDFHLLGCARIVHWHYV